MGRLARVGAVEVGRVRRAGIDGQERQLARVGGRRGVRRTNPLPHGRGSDQVRAHDPGRFGLARGRRFIREVDRVLEPLAVRPGAKSPRSTRTSNGSSQSDGRGGSGGARLGSMARRRV